MRSDTWRRGRPAEFEHLILTIIITATPPHSEVKPVGEMQSRKFNSRTTTSLFHLFETTRFLHCCIFWDGVVSDGLNNLDCSTICRNTIAILTTLIEIQQSWVQEENLPKMYFAKSMIIVSKF